MIFINGASSTGKTTLVMSLQSVLTQSWVSVGIDQWIVSAPLRLYGSHEGHWFEQGERGPRINTGPEFRRLHRAFHRSTTRLLDEGVNVIVDEVLIDPELRDDWLEVLRPYDVTWIGLYCDDAVLQEREDRRRDRAIGMAALQQAYVHEGMRYDMEVDTTATDSWPLAQRIKAVVEGAPEGESP